MLIFFCALSFLVLFLFASGLYKYPHIRRMTTRRIRQNKTSFLWTLFGSMVATALITSSLLLQHSVTDSHDRLLEKRLGPISADLPAERQFVLSDEYFRDEDVRKLSAEYETTESEWLPIVGLEGTLYAKNGDGDPSAHLSSTYMFGFAHNTARVFDPRGAAQLPQALAADEIVLSAATAERLGVEEGSFVYYSDGATESEMTVTSIVPEAGLTGYRGYRNAQASAIVSLETARKWSGAPAETYTNVLATSPLESDSGNPHYYSAVFPPSDWNFVEVGSTLEDMLENSAKLLPVFTIASLTAMATAIALILNLFKMIAVERKQEFGILRAIGFSRTDLSRLLRAEGLFYACLSGIAGTAAGTGLAYLLLDRLKIALSEVMALDMGITVDYQFSADLLSIGGGFALGVLVIGATVMFIANRASSVSIVEALQPETHTQEAGKVKNERFMMLTGLFCFVLVAWLFVLTRLTGIQTYVHDHPALPLVVFSIAFALVLLTVLATVLALGSIAKGMLALTKGFPRLYSVLRLAFRYPLVHRVRTGLIVVMFALVMFLTSFSATFSETVSEIFSDFNAREATGGYDLLAHTPEHLTTEELNEILNGTKDHEQYVQAAVAVQRFQLENYYNMWVHGIDAHFVQQTDIHLTNFDSTYADESEVWEALLQQDDKIIVSETLLQYSGSNASVGDSFEIEISAAEDFYSSPVTVEKTIIGVAEMLDENNSYAPAGGIWTSLDSLEEMFANQVALDSMILIRVPAAMDVREAAGVLNETLALHNLPALDNPDEIFRASTAFLRMFFTIFEGFNAIAIAIGLAGLMIVMLRVVRERRQSIGMLRSIGMSSRSLYGSIWFEGLFLGLTGTLIGLLVGMYSGILMVEILSIELDEWTETMSIQLPYLKLVIYFGAACLLSGLVSSAAARKALKLSPAEATRYTG